MTKRTRADHVTEWESLVASLTARAAEVPELEVSRTKLNALAAEFRSIVPRQKELTASKQELSKRLAAITTEGREIATVLRVALKASYGKTSERLAEFGIPTFRGVTKKKSGPTQGEAPSTPTPATPPSPSSGSSG
jgi:hypothetical protein